MDLYLALGSNLGDRERLLHQAVKEIETRIGTLQCLSALYETAPVGFVSAHPFLNAVARFDTSLPVRDILCVTQQIERRLGRTVKSVGGCHADRTIDIDLLFYGTEVVEADYVFPHTHAPQHLSLPHPLLHQRLFVLEPLCEIAPDVVHPVLRKTVRQLYEAAKQSQ
jgi:2-amino-4-hydroxy-6-hydroxymethyldihydropteridine diphosphokinase